MARYLVAAGEKEPQVPYFFLQEFKPEIANKNPEVQLVAEMLVAFSGDDKRGESIIKGAYLFGTTWRFVILEKIAGDYCYYVSRKYDALVIEEAIIVYSTLVSLKNEIMASEDQPPNFISNHNLRGAMA